MFGGVDDATAIVAIALEGVGHAVGPLALDDEPDGACDRALRRVRDMRRRQDDDFIQPAAIRFRRILPKCEFGHDRRRYRSHQQRHNAGLLYRNSVI